MDSRNVPTPISVEPSVFSVEVLAELSHHERDDGSHMQILVGRTSDAREIKVIGELDSRVGDWIKVTARKEGHPHHGEQWRVENWRPTFPHGPWASAGGYERWFRRLRGVGPKAAAELAQCGPRRLLEEPTLFREIIRSKHGAENARNEFLQYARHCHVSALLEDHNVGPTRQRRLVEAAGGPGDLLQGLKSQPWIYTGVARGVTFEVLDRIGSHLGVRQDSEERLHAGAAFVAERECQRFGHTILPVHSRRVGGRFVRGLVEATADVLKVTADQVADSLGSAPDVSLVGPHWVGPRRLVGAERRIAALTPELLGGAPIGIPRSIIDAVAQRGGLKAEQRQAMLFLNDQHFALFGGGPGTGKTTTIGAFVRALHEACRRVVLIGPTGPAVARLAEAGHCDAMTEHRFLRLCREGNIAADVVIRDEQSMVSTQMESAVLREIATLGAAQIKVGDKDQLSPIDPGDPYSVMVHSNLIPYFELTEIQRQKDDCAIPYVARDIRDGRMPRVARGAGWEMSHLPGATAVSELLLRRVREEAPTPEQAEEAMLLAPVYDGVGGVNALAAAIQEHFNPNPEGEIREKSTNRRWAIGDRVVHIGQDYKTDPPRMHCQRGVIIGVRPGRPPVVVVRWADSVETEHQAPDGKPVRLALGAALTWHRSQGSEWRMTGVGLCGSQRGVASRRALYTAVTRGRELVVLATEAGALEQSLAKSEARYTALPLFLKRRALDIEAHLTATELLANHQ